MNTNMVGSVLTTIVLTIVAWSAPCPGQDLNIEIPVPEIAKKAPAGEDAGKRKLGQRVHGLPENRRTGPAVSTDTVPSLDVSLGEELPATSEADATDLGPLPGERPLLGPLPRESTFSRSRAEAGTNAALREPSWGNPAGIPLRQKGSPESEGATASTAKPKAEKTVSKGSKNRIESKDATARGAWLSRWLQFKRRGNADEKAAEVARRHRASAAREPGSEAAPLFAPRPRLPDPLDLRSLNVDHDRSRETDHRL